MNYTILYYIILFYHPMILFVFCFYTFIFICILYYSIVVVVFGLPTYAQLLSFNINIDDTFYGKKTIHHFLFMLMMKWNLEFGSCCISWFGGLLGVVVEIGVLCWSCHHHHRHHHHHHHSRLMIITRHNDSYCTETETETKLNFTSFSSSKSIMQLVVLVLVVLVVRFVLFLVVLIHGE